MANGDLAASVGMDTVAGSEDKREGYDEINKSRDYLAAHRLTGSHSAGQITSGTLPVARGGTGRPSLWDQDHEAGPNPSSLRILVTDNEDRLFTALGDIAPQYLGFQVHVQNLTSLNFGSQGDLTVAHGAPFTPVGIWVQVRLDHDSLPVEVRPRASSPSWNSENVFLRAQRTDTGLPYPDLVSKADLYCFGVA
jgi:hypothetical protein